MKLVIVESPSKAKTIQKYLGRDFRVVASRGHIRDLSFKGDESLGVDVKNDFEPDYIINDNSKKTVEYLKKISSEAEEVYLATDPDREGEAIAWHIAMILELDVHKTKRLEFHEITKKAVTSALEQARNIDLNLVKSQETRRILDRIIGFKLSSLLQRKIHTRSAGRVQSVVLKLIIEREKEIENFKETKTYGVSLNVINNNKEVKFELVDEEYKDIRLNEEEKLKEVINSVSNSIKIDEIKEEETNKWPFPPFTTSSLQQEAFSVLKFSASKTNKIAQKLYEGVNVGDETRGLITYMRTDSIRLSDAFVYSTKEYIKENYGEDYVGYARKQKEDNKVQDAHEAIRPTKVELEPSSIEKYLNKDEYKLYKLIWDRSVASIMKPAIFLSSKVISRQNNNIFVYRGSKLLFEGFKKVYGNRGKEEDEYLTFKLDEEYKVESKNIDEHKDKPPYRYSEASLIKTMEELGIGRPSTYASTLESLKRSAYIKEDKRYISSTNNGARADAKLNEYFEDIINVDYTANMEKDLDYIAEGTKDRTKTLEDFYNPFSTKVEYAYKHMKNDVKVLTGETCPTCGANLVIMNGRYGEFIACENRPTCDYIKPKDIDKSRKCPDCEDGYLIERKGKYGKFYGCSNYPKCKHMEPIKKKV